uniref:Prefoldin subunit 6 n=1 Tax=Globodera pallida TaxID=36090 RepID=A0A183BNY4_GLOPA
MSTPTSTKPMVIDINSLSIEELSVLQQQFDAELVFFNDSLNELRSVAGKFGRCRATLDSINSDEKDKPALVPLSESVYVRAKMCDPDKYLVEIGTGYFVEMERKRAAEYFKRQEIRLFGVASGDNNAKSHSGKTAGASNNCSRFTEESAACDHEITLFSSLLTLFIFSAITLDKVFLD